MRTDQRAGVASGLPEAPAARVRAFEWLAALRGLWARTEVRWLAGILLVALVVRVVWVASVQPDPRDGRFDDTVWYYSTAQHLLDGDGYVAGPDVDPGNPRRIQCPTVIGRIVMGKTGNCSVGCPPCRIPHCSFKVRVGDVTI